MSKVYIIVDQQHRDRATGEMTSRFDFSSAERYGELVFMLPANTSARDPEANEELADQLTELTNDDYILPVGSPVLILLVGAYASLNQNIDKLNILEWERDRDDRRTGQYLPVTVNLLL